MNIKAKIYHTKLIKNDVVKFLKSHPKYNNKKYVIFPGFCDVHVHFREPGFAYKETIYTGSLSAAHGGYTTVCTMPNLNPVSDTPNHIDEQLKLIKKEALIEVLPYGAITLNEKGEKLSPIEKSASLVVAFSDDGVPVSDSRLFVEALKRANKLNKLMVLHEEVPSLVKGGYIHAGSYAKKHQHKGISSESEYLAIKRDIELLKKNKGAMHICHVSTKEGVRLIRDAKKNGLNVTMETAPHYLLLNDSLLKESGNFKMNPPVRSILDQKELLKALKDGTLDMIATDHAPHSKEEKSKGLKDSKFGITGLDYAFPLLYTYLVKKKIISLSRLLDLLIINPRTRFNINFNGGFSIWDLNKKIVIKENNILSKSKATPFINKSVYGENIATIYKGKVVYQKGVKYGQKK